MGIKGIDNFLKEKCSKDAIKPTTLHELNGCKVCVDMSERIYKSIRKHKNGHVSGTLNLIELLFNWNIKPLIVFDGKSDPAKNKVNQNRNNKRVKAHKRQQSLTQQLNIITEFETTLQENKQNDEKISRSSSNVSLSSLKDLDLDIDINNTYTLDNEKSIEENIHLIKDKLKDEVCKAENKSQGICNNKINEIKELLDFFGIPYIHDKRYEADIICAHLVRNNIVDYCISNDMDMLAFGCNKVVRNLSFTTDLIDIYNLPNILKNLNINYKQFIDMCIMMGCDYTSKLYNIKSNIAYQLIKEYHTIENIIDNLDLINISLSKPLLNNDNFKYDIARNIFKIIIDNDKWKQLISIIDFNEIVNHKIILNSDNAKYKELYNFCVNKCPNLNQYLISNKINTFLGDSFRNFNNYSKYNKPSKPFKYQSYYVNDIKNDIKNKAINHFNKSRNNARVKEINVNLSK